MREVDLELISLDIDGVYKVSFDQWLSYILAARNFCSQKSPGYAGSLKSDFCFFLKEGIVMLDHSF